MEYLAKHTACAVYFISVSVYLSVESTQNTSDINVSFLQNNTDVSGYAMSDTISINKFLFTSTIVLICFNIVFF